MNSKLNCNYCKSKWFQTIFFLIPKRRRKCSSTKCTKFMPPGCKPWNYSLILSIWLLNNISYLLAFPENRSISSVNLMGLKFFQSIVLLLKLVSETTFFVVAVNNVGKDEFFRFSWIAYCSRVRFTFPYTRLFAPACATSYFSVSYIQAK